MRDPASYRDPAGFVFESDGVLLRQVNRSFGANFDACSASGLYDELISNDLLVAHEQVDVSDALTDDAHAVIKPSRIPFVSYPYEWCFGQLRDAALLTLEIQLRALKRGFVLRDASAYNVAFVGARPVFIDTLSFERLGQGEPWAAYGQFCAHFLAPLAVMSYADIRYQQLLRSFIDGVPLDLASRMLPMRTWLVPSLLIHVHLHALSQRRYANDSVASFTRGRPTSRSTLEDYATQLAGAVSRLEWTPSGTEWVEYGDRNQYSGEAAASKADILRAFLLETTPRKVCDLGANTGAYSRIARECADTVIAVDADPAAVERAYRRARAEKDRGLVPILMNLANPSPSQGWAHQERRSLEQRGPWDAVMALALIHHLAISHNVPFPHIAEYFARLGTRLLVEWIPGNDSQVEILLRNRTEVSSPYTVDAFESSFLRWFRIEQKRPIRDSPRVLYLMTRR